MASEQTPLIPAVVIVQERRRPNRARRFATVILSIALIVVVVLFLVPSRRPDGREGHHGDLDEPWQPIGNPPAGFRSKVDREALKKIVIDTPDAKRIEEYSRYYTSGSHLAGKNRSQAEWTRDLWQSFGIKSEIISYEVYLNYPKSSRLALLEEDDHDGSSKVKHECNLEEDVLDEDPTTSLPDRVPVFHGYSASGNVTAQYVYVNFGTYRDYQDLVEAGIDLEGKIALVKYGRNFRGLKVMFAQTLGMAGVIIYDDPQEDGDIVETNGYKAYPEGPARNPSAVQRGSVQFLSIGPGDPTTIGYPSKPGVPRMDPNGTTPKIPSLPISYSQAVPLLKALNGHGPSSKDFNQYWQGGGLEHLGVKYNIGPSPPRLTLNLVNEVESEITPLWNVIGTINGTRTPDESVILGNHRDAWIAGGAGDPNSGSASLNEVVRSYGKALDAGWKPARNLLFASWDGEEYGLVGSTEWVEEYVPWIKDTVMAYVNVDVSTSGPELGVSASPLLHKAIKYATAQIISPNQTIEGQSVYDVWERSSGAQIRPLGSGSDYTAFQDFAGVSSVDIGFKRGPKSPVYHYHSNYDSFHWMSKYGDPAFKYHRTMSQVLGVLTAELVDQPVIHFKALDYAKSLKGYVEAAQKQLDSSTLSEKISFEHLQYLVSELKTAAIDLDRIAAILRLRIRDNPFWWRWLAGRQLRRKIAKVNGAYRGLERSLLYEGGLDERSWFKHIVFAPGRYTGYAGATLPGLLEAIEDNDVERLAKWEKIVADCLIEAKKVLVEVQG